jgi:hypothetical protein
MEYSECRRRWMKWAGADPEDAEGGEDVEALDMALF